MHTSLVYFSYKYYPALSNLCKNIRLYTYQYIASSNILIGHQL